MTSRQRLSEQLPTVAIHHYNKRYIENCSLQPTYRSYQNHSFLYTLPDIPQEGAKPTSLGGAKPTSLGGAKPTSLGGRSPPLWGGEAHLFWGAKPTSFGGAKPTSLGGRSPPPAAALTIHELGADKAQRTRLEECLHFAFFSVSRRCSCAVENLREAASAASD